MPPAVPHETYLPGMQLMCEGTLVSFRKHDGQKYGIVSDITGLELRVSINDLRPATPEDFKAIAGGFIGAIKAEQATLESLDDRIGLTDKGYSEAEAIEVNEHGGRQSKLGHWWTTPYAALAVAEVMSQGHEKYDDPDSTPANGNWHKIPAWSNIQHALTHLHLLAVGNTDEDHLAHAATRLMMALDQRESGRDHELTKDQ